MLIHIPNLLDTAQITYIREKLEAADWTDGALTAGAQAKQVKQNFQLPTDAPEAKELGDIVEQALWNNPLFVSAALPKTIITPRFNAYSDSGHYGNHVDSAIHNDPIKGLRSLRTDVSTTVFISSPDEYEGGELIVEDTYGEHEVKLDAGDAIVYPSTSLHRVEPVTKGIRLASFLWTQSLVKDIERRRLLFELDMNILRLRQKVGDIEEVVAMTTIYHNLLRQWVEA